MKKISTLFKVVYEGKGSKGVLTDEVRHENTWVYTDNVIATRKYDGTAVLVQDGKLYKRYDAKPTKEAVRGHKEGTPWGIGDFREVPSGAIPCQEPDIITGHYPHWIPVLEKDKSNKYLLDTWHSLAYQLSDGSYEFCGEKVGTNAEKIVGHCFFRHGADVLSMEDYSFATIKAYLENPNNDIEGIVFHNLNTMQMCKIRKADFGILR